MVTQDNANTIRMLTFLWCVPRSISTAFEKMMSYSGQFKVIGEPFIDLYKESLVSAEDHLAVRLEFRKMCDALLAKSLLGPVFVKDMAYHASPFITDRFIRSVNNTFLIRDPRLAIPSLFRMRADFAENETGFEGQYKLYERIRDVTGRAPYVMDGEQLKKSAGPIVRDFFQYIGQEMPSDILSWPAGSRNEWVDRESWHLHAINSQGFEDPPEKTNIDQLPHKVLESIERNMFFYEKMREQISLQSTCDRYQ